MNGEGRGNANVSRLRKGIGRGAERVGQRLFNYIDDKAEINKLWGRRTKDVSASPEEKSASEEKSADDNGVDICFNQV